MKSASSLKFLVLATFLSSALPAGAVAVGGDPQELLLDARALLLEGDIDGAASVAGDLRTLLSADPHWDPDGSFGECLLPTLERRIARLQEANRKLVDLADQAVPDESVPEPSQDPEDMEPIVLWGRARAERIRLEAERIARTLPPGEERGALLQTRDYFRVSGLVETEIFPDVGRAVQASVSGLAAENERVRALKARLEALKREMIASSLERERLQERLQAMSSGAVPASGSGTGADMSWLTCCMTVCTE